MLIVAARVGPVEPCDLPEAAERSGLDIDEFRRLVEVGVVSATADGRFTSGDLRRAGLVTSLSAAGVPLDGLAAALRSGQISLAFLDATAFDRFPPLSATTFAQMAERTGVPVEMLMFVREAAGAIPPDPDDRMREAELPYAEWIATTSAAGFRAGATQQMIRAQADGMRRIAETEAAMWQSEVIEPGARSGVRTDAILGNDLGDRMSALSERTVLAMYHLQQTKAWTRNLVEGVESMLADAGLHSRLDRPPAMCFLDITGYTRLTQERGDVAAAQLAEELAGIVNRASVKHGGRAVKWLGDGVMLHFPDPGHGTMAAIEMAAGVTGAGLPPAHIGLHAGPVVFQEGDYYGQTVNVASRIAEYARPHEVIVSQAVVDASGGADVDFREIGPVDLKGVTGPIHLHVAQRPG
jgi:adenylate cyclase